MDQLKQFIEDPKFVKWVFNPNEELESHFSDFFTKHPEQKKKYLQIKKELRLLSITEKEISYSKGAEIFKSISDQINSSKINKKEIRNYRFLMRYAAIALVFFAIGSLFVYFSKGNKTNLQFAEEIFLKNAQTYPVIYFSDGSKKEIKSDKKYIDLSLTGKLVIGKDTISQKEISGNIQN